jgi:hypothetical protein
MIDSEEPLPRRRKGNKAQNLLNRFPIIDLAHAIALEGSNRQKFLTNFVDSSTTLSYSPTREAASMIYGAQKPMFDVPLPTWDEVEAYIRKAARPDILEMNLEASRCLFDFVRSYDYTATDYEPQILRVRLNQIVAIGLPFYITHYDRLIFQFPLIRRSCLSDEAVSILGSIIYHAYAQGDFSIAEIEVADISRPPSNKDRVPRIREIPPDLILDRAALTEQIDAVYEALRLLASRPPKPPENGEAGFI